MDSLRLAGIAVSGGLVLVAVLLAITGGDDGSGVVPEDRPGIVSVEELVELEVKTGHPVYWLGERPSYRIELTEEAKGEIYLRYLPRRVEAGDPEHSYVTVATYPVADAGAALARAGREAGVALHRIDGDTELLIDPTSPRSAYVVPSGEDLQVELFDPEPGRARKLVEAGAVRPVRE